MNLFDGIQAAAFSAVVNTFGYIATWIPSTGIEPITGGILFKDATETAKILEQPYNPKNCMMEYKSGDFTGLYELVSNGSDETVTLNSIEYGVLKITSKWDGKTFYAELQQL